MVACKGHSKHQKKLISIGQAQTKMYHSLMAKVMMILNFKHTFLRSLIDHFLIKAADGYQNESMESNKFGNHVVPTT